MRCGHGVHVINRAIRASAIVIRRAVPTRLASFCEEGLCVGGERWNLALVRTLAGFPALSESGGRWSCWGVGIGA
jgi:hypothetical protein